ncbi:O-antigen ligase family protein [Sphingomonas sp. 1P08PE]|uniref:O-antigen ligase family protein n=1 Tax=Sphingomonas sp. 1P08PE TaxID=554122 RepID=UPI0039A056A9
MLKTSIVIIILSAVALYGLKQVVKVPLRAPVMAAIYATVFAFVALSINQPWIALLVVGVAAAFVTRNRAVAGGMALFLIVTVPTVSQWWVIGGLQMMKIYATTCVVLGMLAASFAWQRSGRGASFAYDLPMYAIVLVLIFSAARGTTPTNMLRVTTEYFIAYSLPYFLVRNALKDADSVRNAFLLIVAAGATLSVIAIFESVRVWPIYQVYGQMFHSLSLANVKMRGGLLRAAGPLMNPPLSSTVLALCFVIALASRDLFRSRSAHLATLALLAVGLFMMQARVGWLGAVAGSFGVMFSRRGAKGMIVPVLIMGMVGGAIYVGAKTNQRFGNLVGFSADAKGSNEYRDALSERGFQIIRQNPVIGLPYAAVEAQMESLRQGEGIIDFTNAYLAIGLFSGYLGLGLVFMSFILQIWFSLSGHRAAKARGAGSFADVGIGVVLAAAGMLPFVPTDYRIMLLIMLFFAVSNAVVAQPGIWLVKAARRTRRPIMHSGDGPIPVARLDPA